MISHHSGVWDGLISSLICQCLCFYHIILNTLSLLVLKPRLQGRCTPIPNLQMRKPRFGRSDRRPKVTLLVGAGIRIIARFLGPLNLMLGWTCNFKDLLPHNQLISSHIIYNIDICWMTECCSEWAQPVFGVSRWTGWIWTSHRSPFNPWRQLSQDICFNSGFYFNYTFSHFWRNIEYKISWWQMGRERGWGCHNQARHKQRLWICKRPIHQRRSGSFLEMGRGRNVSGIFITKVMQQVSSGKETDWQ